MPSSFTILQYTEAKCGYLELHNTSLAKALPSKTGFWCRSSLGMYPIRQKELIPFVAVADLHGNNTQSHQADNWHAHMSSHSSRHEAPFPWV